MDIKKIIVDFPILKQGATYLDSAATSHTPKQVIKALVEFYEEYNSNVHRGIYKMAEKASIRYEDAREKVAEFINAKPSEVIFTSGTTESINFIADAWARKNIGAGDEILITQIEHHANLLPWQRIAQETGATLKYITLNKDFTLDCKNKITPKTKLVAISSDSNVLGPIWGEGELENLIDSAHAVGAKVLIDAAQAVSHMKTDVKELDADFVVFSGHKMLGPTGVGVLYIKEELHDKVGPYKVGGSMVHSVNFDSATWKEAPYKFEAGTPPIAQVIALGEAIKYFDDNIDFEELKIHEAKLCNQLLDGLEKKSCVTILGNMERIKKNGHLVSFVVDGVHGHDIAAYLGEKGVQVRAGHHCAQPLHNLLNVEASIRASLYVYNTEEDVDRFSLALDEAIKYFRGEQ